LCEGDRSGSLWHFPGTQTERQIKADRCRSWTYLALSSLNSSRLHTLSILSSPVVAIYSPDLLTAAHRMGPDFSNAILSSSASDRVEPRTSPVLRVSVVSSNEALPFTHDVFRTCICGPETTTERETPAHRKECGNTDIERLGLGFLQQPTMSTKTRRPLASRPLDLFYFSFFLVSIVVPFGLQSLSC